jgi:hypothetical protein
MRLRTQIATTAVTALLLVCAIPFSSPAQAVSCKPITDRTWKLIYKSPGKYKGKNYTVWGNIWQFDDATGPDTFLSYVSGTNKFDGTYFSGSDDAMLKGSAKKLANYVEGDVYKACVTVKGSYTYDRAQGGTNTVPLLTVNSIRYLGSTD